MGKLFGGFFGILIVALIIYLLFWKLIFDAGSNLFDEHTAPLKELVGEQVVIKGDTLEIVDYTSWNETVTLDDTRTIDATYAKSKLLKSE